MTATVVHRRSGEGKAVEDASGGLLVFKAGRELGFDSLFFEMTVPPGHGAPPHTDPSEELFYVLEGEFEFVSDGGGGLSSRPLAVGDAVCVPRGAPHTFRNVGSGLGRMLVFFPENRQMEGFFDDISEPVADAGSWTPGSRGQSSLERVAAACERWGVGFAGPPPGG
jgi:quercetin dioxygenase-like cupin family protein